MAAHMHMMDESGRSKSLCLVLTFRNNDELFQSSPHAVCC